MIISKAIKKVAQGCQKFDDTILHSGAGTLYNITGN